MKPGAADETTKDIIKMFQNIPDTMKKPDARTLYNYTQDIKQRAADNKNALKATASTNGAVITDKALDPLISHIEDLKNSSAPASEIKANQELLKQLQAGFDSN